MLCKIYRQWQRSREARIRRLQRLPLPQWQAAKAKLPLLDQLAPLERVHLRQLTSAFVQEKVFSGANGLKINSSMRTCIAAQACLLILHMNQGLRPFRGWTEVIVYPDTFRVRHETLDEAGVLHISEEELAGESWDRGPIILSWGDIATDEPDADLNGAIILHEFAHKLDALSGTATGMPPLRRDMDRAEWTRVFTAAFEKLGAEVNAGRNTAIDPYAAESPPEFFAVATEYYFEYPETLKAAYPEVYKQLERYYLGATFASDPAS
ncbi:MAG: zinc-dependent peptidase [Chromatocurvus sp.]